MRNYYNGGSSGETPPGSMQGRANHGAGPGSSSSSGSLFMGGPSGQRRSTSTSLPRSPDANELGGFVGTGSVSSQDSHQGNQEVYANIYQNIPSHTSNHSSMFVSAILVSFLKHVCKISTMKCFSNLIIRFSIIIK